MTATVYSVMLAQSYSFNYSILRETVHSVNIFQRKDYVLKLKYGGHILYPHSEARWDSAKELENTTELKRTEFNSLLVETSTFMQFKRPNTPHGLLSFTMQLEKTYSLLTTTPNHGK